MLTDFYRTLGDVVQSAVKFLKMLPALKIQQDGVVLVSPPSSGYASEPKGPDDFSVRVEPSFQQGAVALVDHAVVEQQRQEPVGGEDA